MIFQEYYVKRTLTNVGHIIVYFDGTAFRFGDVTALSQMTLKAKLYRPVKEFLCESKSRNNKIFTCQIHFKGNFSRRYGIYADIFAKHTIHNYDNFLLVI